MNKTITYPFSIKMAYTFLFFSTLFFLGHSLLVISVLFSPPSQPRAVLIPMSLIEILLFCFIYWSYKRLVIPARNKKIALELNTSGIYNHRNTYKISWDDIVDFRNHSITMIEIELKDGIKIKSLSNSFFRSSISDGNRMWQDLILLDTKFIEGKRSEIISTLLEYLHHSRN